MRLVHNWQPARGSNRAQDPNRRLNLLGTRMSVCRSVSNVANKQKDASDEPETGAHPRLASSANSLGVVFVCGRAGAAAAAPTLQKSSSIENGACRWSGCRAKFSAGHIELQ